MFDQTWKFADRENWSSGPWDIEHIDKAVWLDSNTGLDCMIHRNGSGSWCGYVGVKSGSSLHGVPYDDYYGSGIYLNAHGGITRTEGCSGMAPNGRGICHPADGDDHVWWIGFDCSHLSDANPADSIPYYGGAYRDQSYVIQEVTNLARQIDELSGTEKISCVS